ncbi:MAG: OmpA family protein [Balneolales bacterium]|nr:OmpA family protein [Balneolales bacterium]
MKSLILLALVPLMFISCRSSRDMEPEPVQEQPQQPSQEAVEREIFGDENQVAEPAPVAEERDPQIASLNQINFDFDSSNLGTNARNQLRQNVEKLKASPNYRVRVEAFTDNVGSDQYNLRLSVRRANSVADFYRQNGISSDRITVAGLGVDPNPCMNPIPGDRGCRENRRAHSEPIAPFGATRR